MRYKRSLFFMVAAALSLTGLVPFGGADEAKTDNQAEIELATVCVDELCGYVDQRGQWQIPPKFAAADPFSKEGFAFVIVKDKTYKGRIGEVITELIPSEEMPPYVGGVGDFPTRGYSETYAMTPYGGKIGVIDAKGNFADQSHFFGEVKEFSANGLAAAETYEATDEDRFSSSEQPGRWGVINTRGQWVIEPQFDFVRTFPDDDRALVKVKGQWGAIDAEGQWLIKPEFEALLKFSNNGLTGAKLNNKWGFLNTKGQWVIEPKYDYVTLFSDKGLARVEIGRKEGLIDDKGQWVIQPKFDGLASFSDRGLAMAKVKGKWGIINAKGQWTIKPLFDDIWDLSLKGPAAAQANGQWGLINAEGRWIIEPKFEWAEYFFDTGLAQVKSNGKWGLVDADGQWVLEPEFDGVRPFYHNDQLVFVVTINGKQGILDAEKQWLLKPEIESFLYFYDSGLAAAKLNGKYGIINALGQWVFPPEYNEACEMSARLAAAKKWGPYGIVSRDGQWVITPKFLEVSRPKKGNLVEVRAYGHGTGTGWVNCYVDIDSASYRTGLNEKPEEPGFRWDFAGGRRTLYNRQDEQILTIERRCHTEVAKNGAQEIIWPLNGLAPVCDGKNELKQIIGPLNDLPPVREEKNEPVDH